MIENMDANSDVNTSASSHKQTVTNVKDYKRAKRSVDRPWRQSPYSLLPNNEPAIKFERCTKIHNCGH